jgi:hypothetical protein
MSKLLLVAALAALSLTACSGGGGSSPTTPGQPGGGSGGGTTSSVAQSAVSDAGDLGASVHDLSDFARDEASSGLQPASACRHGVEFFAPDKKGDPNSTETQFFYDLRCSDLARDVVRLINPTGASSENVARTVASYAPHTKNALAIANENATILDATFDQYGFPYAANGFARAATAQLSLAGVETIAWGDEIVLQPVSGAVNGFCSDSAGYNVTGIPGLGITFGWQGTIPSGGSRTLNGDGSVTWDATRLGTAFKAAIGAPTIGQSTQNTICPIGTPAFTLNGATQIASDVVPVSATFLDGRLTNLTITNATFSNGDTLNAATNAQQPPWSDRFITGTLANGTTTLATFGVNAFGDGVLTVTSTGARYAIVDWRVVR